MYEKGTGSTMSVNANFPLSLAVELRIHGLRLDSAKWSRCCTSGGFSVAFFWPTDMGQGYAVQPQWCRRRRKPKSHSDVKGPDTIRYQSEQSNMRAGNPQPVNRQPFLIDEHQRGTTSLLPHW